MNRSPEQAVMSYLTDMLALEEHIEKALKAQISDFEQDYPEVVTQLRMIHATTEQHVASLKGLTDQRDGGRGVGDAIKRVAAVMAGFGAAAVDLFRTGKLPKDLRDDFTALSLAAIGYVMLATTARSLDEPTVAAQRAAVCRNHSVGLGRSIRPQDDLAAVAVGDGVRAHGCAHAHKGGLRVTNIRIGTLIITAD